MSSASTTRTGFHRTGFPRIGFPRIARSRLEGDRTARARTWLGSAAGGLLFAGLVASCGPEPPGPLPPLQTLAGEAVPAPVPGAAATLLVYTRIDCPISNRYAPEIARLAGEFEGRGVAFRLVYAVDADPTAIAAHAEEYALRLPLRIDAEGTLGARLGLTITPEVALLTPDGELAYRGRIDDRWVDFGQARPEPTTRDLHAALEAVLAGRTPDPARTRAVGCPLPGWRP